ncbi:MAG: hypothetical protein IKQ77_04520 [Prevotella sp.]|nr:hypothetical protein [Prevotella sp.]
MSQNTFLKESTMLQGIKYVIRKQLGQVGFEITYEAEQMLLGKRVVIKELFMDGVCDRADDGKSVLVSRDNREFFMKQKNGFLNEARRLTNRNLSPLVDLFEENGTVYFVMDFIEGKNLDDLPSLLERPSEEKNMTDILERPVEIEPEETVVEESQDEIPVEIEPKETVVEESQDGIPVEIESEKTVVEESQDEIPVEIELEETVIEESQDEVPVEIEPEETVVEIEPEETVVEMEQEENGIGVEQEETSTDAMVDEAAVKEKLHSFSREEIEQYGISIISFSPGQSVTIYYRGYTYECDLNLVLNLKSFNDMESAICMVKESLRVKDVRRRTLEAYLKDNADLIGHAFNMITFCSESDLLELLSLQRDPSVFGDHRIEMEMQLIPLCFDSNKDSACSVEYQCQYCDMLLGGGVVEILQVGFIGDKRYNWGGLSDVENEPVTKKLSAFEGFTFLVLGAVIQSKIVSHVFDSETILLSLYPFEIDVEIWMNDSYRDGFNLIESMVSIPYKRGLPIVDDNSSFIVVALSGRRFKIDVNEVFGYIPKQMEMICVIELSYGIEYTIIDVNNGKKITMSQSELFEREIID